MGKPIFLRITPGIVVAAVLAAALAGASPLDKAYAEAAGSWTQKKPLPSPRAEAAAVALDGKLHEIGGNRNLVSGTYHDEYDPKTDTWRTLAPLPAPRDHISVVALNGKIYAIGGFAKPVHLNPSNAAFEYDPATNTWRTLAPMKVARGAAGVAVVDGKIHVVGGRGSDGVVVADHEVFDPATGIWTDAAPLPAARDHLIAAAINGKLHAIGGRMKDVINPDNPKGVHSIDFSGEHDVYDPATDKWTSAALLPMPRSGVATVVYNGQILVLGGEKAGAAQVENEAYDPKTDRWTTLAPMPDGRHGFGGGVIGDDAYFAAGSLTQGDVGATDQLIMFHEP